MKIGEITDIIERYAPLDLQASYDNSGLVVGRREDEVHAALLAVDVTDDVMDEAERTGCDLVITHHPIVFHPLKRFNSANQVERCVERAIRSRIALYACHTNLDSTPGGMSWFLAGRLGIGDLRVLQPTRAGDERVGYGIVGSLAEPRDPLSFLQYLRQKLQVKVVRHSDICLSEVRTVAICTGAGASLTGDAIAAGADLYITSDLKYNDFMTPDGKLIVADIGHFESEYCAIDLLHEIISKNLCTFAVRRSVNSRNPIHYLV